MKFSEKVYWVRRKLGYSQEYLTQKLHVSFATVNKWESEKIYYERWQLFSWFCEKII